MTAQIVKDAPSVQRLMFGKYVTPTQMGHCHSPVLSFMRNASGVNTLIDGEPNRAAGAIPITSAVEERLHSAALDLDTPPFSRDAGKGPYADKDGMVQRLARAVISNAGDDRALIIDRVMDLLRPFAGVQAEMLAPRTFHDEEFNFILSDGCAAIPDVLPYAGAILTQRERRTLNDDTGAPSIILTSMMEPYVLAAAVLRQAGLAAYPSLAVLPDEQGGEFYTPVMSIVNVTGEVPLQTFALLRAHPDFSSLILMSDAAVMGVLNIIVAETRAKHLCVDIVEHSKQGLDIQESVVDNQLKRIANALFEGHMLWPGTHFINDAVAFMNNELAKASIITYVSQKEAMEAMGPLCNQIAAAVATSQTISEALSRLAAYANSPAGLTIEQLFEEAVGLATRLSGSTLTYLSMCVESSRPHDTFEHNRKQPGQ
ncbi:MAG: hypothetical protein PHV13_04070 [Candidatus ainarchaeum sp.]|nr:hypothetical protein [Candidatus ainarchaeum sp.]